MLPMSYRYVVCLTVWRACPNVGLTSPKPDKHGKDFCPKCKHRLTALLYGGCVPVAEGFSGHLKFEERKT